MSFKPYLVEPSSAKGLGSGDGGVANIPSGGDGVDCRFNLDVTAVSGTAPTADVTVTAVIEGVTITLVTFTQATGVTAETINVVNCPDAVQINWTIGGSATPTVTFSVRAWRH